MSARNRWKDLSTRRIVTVLSFVLLLVLGLIILICSAAFVTSPLWNNVLNIIGTLIAVSVAASFLYSVLLRQRDDATRKKELAELLDNKIEEIIEGRFFYGLHEFCQKMDFTRLFNDLKKGDELWWLDTYAPGHKHWIDCMYEAVRRGAIIRILALKPNCINADHRAEEIGGLYLDSFNSELDSFIKDIKCKIKCWEDEKSEDEKSIEGGFLDIREYEDLPCIPIYLVSRDKTPIYAYTSFFLCKPTAVDFPHMSWRPSEGSLLNHLFPYIKNKWDRNKPSIEPDKGH
jgi:hypothetical protein